MNKIVLIIFCLLSFVNADNLKKEICKMEQVGEIEIVFEGYKTSFKVGVTGGFNKIEYKIDAKDAKNISELLKNYSVIIDKQSVFSTQEPITKNLLKYFFNILKNDKIEAKILDLKAKNHDKVIAAAKRKEDKISFDYKKGSIVLEVKMNNVVKNVDMTYYIKNDTLHSVGKLNLLDFNAADALTSLNKACFDKHLGKTWSDISIKFIVKTQKICKKGVEL